MKRSIESIAAAALAVATAGPAEAVVTGGYFLEAKGRDFGSSVVGGSCKDVLHGAWPDEPLFEAGGPSHDRSLSVQVGSRDGGCASESGETFATARVLDVTKEKMEAGERSLSLLVGTGKRGDQFSATATAQTGIKGSFLVKAPDEIKKDGGKDPDKEPDKIVVSDTETPPASSDPAALPETGFLGQALLRIEVDGTVAWRAPLSGRASGALRLRYDKLGDEAGETEGALTVNMFELGAGLDDFDCTGPDPSSTWAGLEYLSGPDCVGLAAGDARELKEEEFGTSTYEFLLGYDAFASYDLHVELLLSAWDGATADFLNSAKLSLFLPTEASFVDQAGSDIVRAIGVVPVPPAALLLLSGFGVAAVVRKRARA